ncbi:MAG: hypothetical protein KKF44_11330, partial [Nanoarchaeota archaeon]|nr:hypothetical protein [Nanoarchaeota archaeon]
MNSKMIKLKYLTINEKIEEMNTCTFNVIDYINHDNTEYSFNGDLITLYYYKTSKITIKKVIKLSKELAWFIGFYFAEGTKSKNTFAFSNCNTTLFNMCISICQKNLGIPNNSWKLYLTTNKNGLMSNSLKNNFNQSEIGIKINKLSLRDNLEARINNRILVYIFNELTDNFIHRIITDRE